MIVESRCVRRGERQPAAVRHGVTLAACCAVAAVLVAAGVTGVSAQERGAEPPPVPADAYADEAARELVRLARIRRGMVDTRISAYTTRAVERISARIGTPLGDRLLFRRETASDVSWTRDSVHIHVLGAREVMPVVNAQPKVPPDLASYMPSMAFDPVDSQMLLSLEGTSLRHPLAADGEQHYRFASGDTTVIRLPDGRAVRLRELRVLPRRAEPQLISGSLWLEAETHAVVQAHFRLARPVDTSRDGGGPAFPVRAEIDYIVLDYGLWELQWWLPRLAAGHGVVHFAGRRFPISFERRYGDYTVTGDPQGAPLASRDSVAKLCRPPIGMEITADVRATPHDTMTAASAARLQARRDSARAARRVERGDTTAVCERPFVVTRADHPDLIVSAELPADIYGGDALVDERELAAIADRLRSVAVPPWQVGLPRIEWPLNRPGLVRYNRVEGLSLGARAVMDFGRASADAGVRVGTSGEVGAELGLVRSGARAEGRLAGYRRLDVVDPATDPFGLRSTVGALFLGRDDHDYFRATGAELRLRPPAVRSQWYDLRLFAERQEAVSVDTDFSLLRLVDPDRGVRPNVAADRADQVGATLRLRTAYGLNPDAFRWGAELELHGEAGDYRFARPAVRMRATTPLVGRLTLGGEAAAGSSFGDAPLQRLWQLGGAATLRGYEAGAARGEAFWLGRAELGYGLPFARLVAFTDAGWAGPRSDFTSGRALSSVGAGIGLLDGLLRLDVARARETGRWRVHLNLNGTM